MRRRDVLGLIGGAAVFPAASHAQQSSQPRIGFVSSSSPGEATRFTAFHRGLEEMGFVAGRNVAIEYRYAAGAYDRLPGLIRELLELRAAVIFASALPAALAAKSVTTTVPIVFASGADPVQLGLVGSLNRPGGNITGVSNYFGALGGKRLEVLREILPRGGPIGYLLNPRNQNAVTHSAEVSAAAKAMSQPLESAEARDDVEIERAFAKLAQLHVVAVLIGDDPFYNTQRRRLVELAARHRLPAMYYDRGFVTEGGLISYGSSQEETYRQSGLYVGRVLKGENPGDLPVVLPSKFELVVNLKTAKSLGLSLHGSLLARADEVIE